MTAQPPLSGVVVCFNEASLLPACLDALSFCDERLVVDLGSEDDSVDVAQACGARVMQHPWVPVVEEVRRFTVDQAEHDWVVFMDPDVVFPAPFAERVRELIRNNPDISCMRVCCQYYFERRPLRHGRWGGFRPGYPAVLHRRRMDLTETIHDGMRPVSSYRDLIIEPNPGQVFAHHWAPTLETLLEKHRRYYMVEAQCSMRAGERFSWLRTAARVGAGVVRGLAQEGGWRDGRTGLFLSLFWGSYLCNAGLALRHLEKHGDEVGFEGIRDSWLHWLYRDLLRVVDSGGARGAP